MAEVKILKGLASLLVSLRELRGKYFTNRDIKAFDLFICLKSLTTSGHIQSYYKQFDRLLTFCKCSKGTFYTRLAQLASMGLVSVRGGRLSVVSWQKVADMFDLVRVDFHKINYDETNKLQSIEYFIKLLETVENQQAQATEATRKLVKTPEIKQVFETYCNKHGQEANFTLHNLHAAQKCSFSQGADDYDVLHLVNADLQRSARKIKKAFGFHSIRCVAYMKRQFVRRGLASVIHRPAPVCRWDKDKPKQASKGRLKDPVRIGAVLGFIVTSNEAEGKKRGSKSKLFTTFYYQHDHAKVWRLPDQIIASPNLIK